MATRTHDAFLLALKESSQPSGGNRYRGPFELPQRRLSYPRVRSEAWTGGKLHIVEAGHLLKTSQLILVQAKMAPERTRSWSYVNVGD